jgi:hypothetical protein
MRGERKYLIVLVTAFLIYVAFQIITPKPINWTISLAHEDKNPFGTFVLDNIIDDLFSDVSKSYLTSYERQDSLQSNQLIITTNFFPDPDDLDVLMNHIYDGGNVFISAHNFTPLLSDTLGFRVADYLFDADFTQNLQENDSTILYFVNASMNPADSFRYQRNNIYRRFSEIDTAVMEVTAVNDLNQPVTVRVTHGDGSLILNTTPLAFSNYYLLKDENHQFAERSLSMLPDMPLHWAEYYMQGRRESRTPLRYILSQPSLTWAYYLLLAALAIYMVLESKRKQRIIPVIKPLRNSTLDFVGTVSSLYLKKKNHRSIADKRITFFLDQLRNKYFLSHRLEGKALYEKIAAKSGHSVEEVEKLMSAIMEIRMKSEITEDELKEINSCIEDFNL